jgi:hypothetical protein
MVLSVLNVYTQKPYAAAGFDNKQNADTDLNFIRKNYDLNTYQKTLYFRMENVKSSEGELISNYVIINRSASEINRILFLDKMKPVLLNKVCSHPKLKVFWENGVSASYVYSGSDNQYIGKITIAPSQCGF